MTKCDRVHAVNIDDGKKHLTFRTCLFLEFGTID